MDNEIFDDLLKPCEAAAEIRRSTSTLAKDRIKGTGPRFVMIGGRVYYKRADLKKWVDDQIAASLGESA